MRFSEGYILRLFFSGLPKGSTQFLYCADIQLVVRQRVLALFFSDDVQAVAQGHDY